jgi:hypothetical protein
MYALWESLWRRMFGSDGWNLPVLRNRAFQHILNVLATGVVLYFTGLNWLLLLATIGIFEGCYWSWGHGPGFDMGRGGNPDEKMLERYKERFWNKWCEKLLPKSLWYTKRYDALWMFFRYEIPAIGVALCSLNAWFLLAGFSTTLAYLLCWKAFDKGLLKNATDVAEWIVGGITGLLLVL